MNEPTEVPPAGPDRAHLTAEPAWIIETSALTKRFHQLTAVDALTLSVSEGQVHVFILRAWQSGGVSPSSRSTSAVASRWAYWRRQPLAAVVGWT
jgi:hypothetical protein